VKEKLNCSQNLLPTIFNHWWIIAYICQGKGCYSSLPQVISVFIRILVVSLVALVLGRSTERNLAATISRLIFRVTLTSCHSVSLVVGRFCRGWFSSTTPLSVSAIPTSRSLSKRSSSRYGHAKITQPSRSLFEGSTWNDRLDHAPASLCHFLRSKDCELTYTIITLLRTSATLRSRVSRDALKIVDCHSPWRGRNVSRIQRARVKALWELLFESFITEFPKSFYAH